MERTRQAIEGADLIFVVAKRRRALDCEDDRRVIEQVKEIGAGCPGARWSSTRRISLRFWTRTNWKTWLAGWPVVRVSAVHGAGLDRLAAGGGRVMLGEARGRRCDPCDARTAPGGARRGRRALEEAREHHRARLPLDLASVDLQEALEASGK